MNQLSLKPGATLRSGTYRIDRKLGQGGFGITYLATDLSLDKQVAIKEFFPKDFCNREGTTSHVTLGTQGNAEFVTRLKAKFLKEAKSIAKFDHPNIIKIHAAFEENNTAYYVMDYIEGESLSQRVKRDGALPRAAALEYINTVGRALSYVHSFNINHLDVKPANIMVRKSDNRPILIDFGLSKQYDSEGNQTSTTPVAISHGYAPMEQYRKGGVGEFSPTTDEYSLAATLYYLLSGITPPESTQLAEEDLTFPASIPTDLIAAISKAMSPARKNRYPTVQQFVDALSAKHNVEETVIEPQHHDVRTREQQLAGNDLELQEDDSEFSESDDDLSQEQESWPKRVSRAAVIRVAIVLSFIAVGALMLILIPRMVISFNDTEDTIPTKQRITVQQTVTDYRFHNSKGLTFTYTGTITADSIPTGNGIGVYSNGTYKGSYSDGLRHGEGTFDTSDGQNHFIGTFANDFYDNGTLTLADGMYFKGSFKAGNPYNGKWYTKGNKVYSVLTNGK